MRSAPLAIHDTVERTQGAAQHEQAEHAETLDRIYAPKELPRITGLSLPTIWRMQKRGDFPPFIRLSPGRCGLSESAIRRWREERAARK